ncbi:putative transcription factor WD40-like family [Rosa chinensis]|uniref:Putative transcription factor WD40-like family n=1 Tax=Rosa chinensis TaxID=74649 RepID=A0A2P6RA39_ROSCH|nr:WD repeat-containing protein 44 [Rosa chinensis]PRQ43281.1 putative transcription factor WD40-like family [Rosa chinensis]
MIMEPKMERKRTFAMNWDGLHDEEDDDRFFESRERISSAVPIDLEASSSDDEDFDDSRMSFASCVSSVRNDVEVLRALSAAEPSFASSPPMSPDYNIWMAAPGSISERRRRLLQGMGLANGGKDIVSFRRLVSNKAPNGVFPAVTSCPTRSREKIQVPETAPEPDPDPEPESGASNSPLPMMLVRSRSEGEIEAFSADKRRKEQVIGTVSKQRLTRTSSAIAAPSSRMCFSTTPQSDVGTKTVRSRQNSAALSTEFTNNLGAFFLIKNLDTGTEFIVNEYDQNGCWNKFSDLQTGKKLTVDEFEKSVGYSPVVKEVMRRQNVNIEAGIERKVPAGANSFVSKSLRMSKRKVALLKNSIKGVGSAVSVLIGDKDQHASSPPPPLPQDQKSSKANSGSGSEWIKVRQTGKSYKELSALHLCQEIQAHEGSIWTIKFSLDARFLASAGEDRVIHVWEVQECEIMSMDSNANPLHPSSVSPYPDRSMCLSSEASISSEKKKKGKGGSSRKTNPIPDYVHVPEFVFALSEKPVCSFEGHLDAVLDLSWSRDQLLLSSSMDKTVRLWDMVTKSCLKMFAHNDYVTCIQFNPLDDSVFLSGSLDAKLRLWDISDRRVVDWTDLHEMVTAACYTPDGQAAIIGSHKGNCRMYNAEDCKLSQEGQIDIKNKKKNQAKKVTGFQFSPINPSEMLVTSADSRIRIVDGKDVTHKFRGFRNTSSQIGASFTPNGKYIICASEDSHVYVWKREEPRVSAAGKKSTITTTSHEYFQCKDVSVAIPWPGTIKGDPPPPVSVHSSKRHSKRSSVQPVSGTASPTQDGGDSKRFLPPLPKKNTNPSTPPSATAEKTTHLSTPPNATAEKPSTPPPEDQDPSEISRTDSGIGESFSSDPSSIRYGGDSPSISSGNASSSWSSSWSSLFGHESSQTTQAWGLVIVTATLEGEIRAYQNFGIPRRVPGSFFGGPT